MVDQSEFCENKNLKRFSEKKNVGGSVEREWHTVVFFVRGERMMRLVGVKLITEMEEEAG